MRLSEISLDSKGLVVTGHSLFKLLKPLKREAEVVVCFGKTRFENEGLGNEINGDVVLAKLMGNNPKQMHDERLIWFR